MLEETIKRPADANYYSHYASVTGLPSELAMSACDTSAFNAEQRAADAERFEDGLSPHFLAWRVGNWERANPMPQREEPETDEWIEWNRRRQIARARMYEPLMQELIDANGGDPVDHGTILMGMDA